MEQWEQFMDLSNKELSKAYCGFRAEASACVLEDVVLFALMISTYFLIKDNLSYIAFVYSAVYAAFLLLRIHKVYKPVLLSYFDIYNHAYISETLQIHSIHAYDSWTGRWSNKITKLFPAELKVKRYIVKCYTVNGQKLSLHCIMGKRTHTAINTAIFQHTPLKRTVIYGKFSRIIIKFSGKDELSFILNHHI